MKMKAMANQMEMETEREREGDVIKEREVDEKETDRCTGRQKDCLMKRQIDRETVEETDREDRNG